MTYTREFDEHFPASGLSGPVMRGRILELFATTSPDGLIDGTSPAYSLFQRCSFI
jgi:hypothetical protein